MDSTENDVWPPTKDVQNQNNVLRKVYAHIYPAPKIMNPLMELVFEVVPDAKNQPFANKMDFADFPMVCV